MSSKTSKCNCYLCYRNDAGSNRQRTSYARVWVKRDEDGWFSSGTTKKSGRQLRRVRENRMWIREEW